ncbi:MAG: PRC-barrel domain-containing protein [Parcubacteria group bacterium]|nr:PRC-barrel domain-containing protein [Parcubacteria group bacterium]
MFIDAKKLLGLPVETEGEQKLGKVVDFDIDIDSHIIKSYSIESGFLEKKKLLISRNQVVSIGNEKMIVKDGAIKEEINEKKEAIVNAEPALPVSLSKK